MESESARMASAAEAKFRIDAPNSKPRAIKIIALDPPSEQVVKQLAQSRWNCATFFTASAFAGKPRRTGPFSMDGWLSDLAGRARHAWWLNPEHPRHWGTGDSAADRYGEIVPMVECRNLTQLGEFVHEIV